MKIRPAELPPRSVIPWIDTREQNAWQFLNLGAPVVKTLNVADYSFVGGEDYFRIERKSGPDYLGSIFTERFDREMQLIKAFAFHALIVEGSWDWLESGDWRIKANAKAVTGKTLGFIESGVNVILADNRERAQLICERLIYMCARRRYRELRTMLANVIGEEAEMEANDATE